MTPSLPRPDVFSFEERQNSALIRSAKLGQLLAAFPITGQSFGAYTWLPAPVLTTTPRPGAFCGKPSRQTSSRSDIPRRTKAVWRRRGPICLLIAADFPRGEPHYGKQITNHEYASGPARHARPALQSYPAGVGTGVQRAPLRTRDISQPREKSRRDFGLHGFCAGGDG